MVGRKSSFLVSKRSLRNAEFGSGKRPRRIVQPKLLDDTVGMSRREEQELNRALYASLNDSRRSKSMPSLTSLGDADYFCGSNPSNGSGGGGIYLSSTSSSMRNAVCISNSKPSSSKPGSLSLGKRRAALSGNPPPKRIFRRSDSAVHRPKPKSNLPGTQHRGRADNLIIDESSQDSVKSSSSSANGSKKKIHAQRKFAQGCSLPGTPTSLPTKASTPPVKLLSHAPKTEDFLTFLCLRGSSALPPHLDFFNFSREELPPRSESSKADSTGSRSKRVREVIPDETSSTSSGANEEIAEAAVVTPNMTNKHMTSQAKRSAARASAGTPETARGIVSLRQGLQRKVSSSSSSSSASPHLCVFSPSRSVADAGRTTNTPPCLYKPKFYFIPEKAAPQEASGILPGEFTPPSKARFMSKHSPLIFRPSPSELGAMPSSPRTAICRSSSSPSFSSSYSSSPSSSTLSSASGSGKRKQASSTFFSGLSGCQVTDCWPTFAPCFAVQNHLRLASSSSSSSSTSPSPPSISPSSHSQNSDSIFFSSSSSSSSSHSLFSVYEDASPLSSTFESSCSSNEIPSETDCLCCLESSSSSSLCHHHAAPLVSTTCDAHHHSSHQSELRENPEQEAGLLKGSTYLPHFSHGQSRHLESCRIMSCSHCSSSRQPASSNASCSDIGLDSSVVPFITNQNNRQREPSRPLSLTSRHPPNSCSFPHLTLSSSSNSPISSSSSSPNSFALHGHHNHVLSPHAECICMKSDSSHPPPNCNNSNKNSTNSEHIHINDFHLHGNSSNAYYQFQDSGDCVDVYEPGFSCGEGESDEEEGESSFVCRRPREKGRAVGEKGSSGLKADEGCPSQSSNPGDEAHCYISVSDDMASTSRDDDHGDEECWSRVKLKKNSYGKTLALFKRYHKGKRKLRKEGKRMDKHNHSEDFQRKTCHREPRDKGMIPKLKIKLLKGNKAVIKKSRKRKNRKDHSKPSGFQTEFIRMLETDDPYPSSSTSHSQTNQVKIKRIHKNKQDDRVRPSAHVPSKCNCFSLKQNDIEGEELLDQEMLNGLNWAYVRDPDAYQTILNMNKRNQRLVPLHKASKPVPLRKLAVERNLRMTAFNPVLESENEFSAHYDSDSTIAESAWFEDSEVMEVSDTEKLHDSQFEDASDENDNIAPEPLITADFNTVKVNKIRAWNADARVQSNVRSFQQNQNSSLSKTSFMLVDRYQTVAACQEKNEAAVSTIPKGSHENEERQSSEEKSFSSQPSKPNDEDTEMSEERLKSPYQSARPRSLTLTQGIEENKGQGCRLTNMTSESTVREKDNAEILRMRSQQVSIRSDPSPSKRDGKDVEQIISKSIPSTSDDEVPLRKRSVSTPSDYSDEDVVANIRPESTTTKRTEDIHVRSDSSSPDKSKETNVQFSVKDSRLEPKKLTPEIDLGKSSSNASPKVLEERSRKSNHSEEVDVPNIGGHKDKCGCASMEARSSPRHDYQCINMLDIKVSNGDSSQSSCGTSHAPSVSVTTSMCHGKGQAVAPNSVEKSFFGLPSSPSLTINFTIPPKDFTSNVCSGSDRPLIQDSYKPHDPRNVCHSSNNTHDTHNVCQNAKSTHDPHNACQNAKSTHGSHNVCKSSKNTHDSHSVCQCSKSSCGSQNFCQNSNKSQDSQNFCQNSDESQDSQNFCQNSNKSQNSQNFCQNLNKFQDSQNFCQNSNKSQDSHNFCQNLNKSQDSHNFCQNSNKSQDSHNFCQNSNKSQDSQNFCQNSDESQDSQSFCQNSDKSQNSQNFCQNSNKSQNSQNFCQNLNKSQDSHNFCQNSNKSQDSHNFCQNSNKSQDSQNFCQNSNKSQDSQNFCQNSNKSQDSKNFCQNSNKSQDSQNFCQNSDKLQDSNNLCQSPSLDQAHLLNVQHKQSIPPTSETPKIWIDDSSYTDEEDSLNEIVKGNKPHVLINEGCLEKSVDKVFQKDLNDQVYQKKIEAVEKLIDNHCHKKLIDEVCKERLMDEICHKNVQTGTQGKKLIEYSEIQDFISDKNKFQNMPYSSPESVIVESHNPNCDRPSLYKMTDSCTQTEPVEREQDVTDDLRSEMNDLANTSEDCADVLLEDCCSSEKNEMKCSEMWKLGGRFAFSMSNSYVYAPPVQVKTEETIVIEDDDLEMSDEEKSESQGEMVRLDLSSEECALDLSIPGSRNIKVTLNNTSLSSASSDQELSMEEDDKDMKTFVNELVSNLPEVEDRPTKPTLETDVMFQTSSEVFPGNSVVSTQGNVTATISPVPITLPYPSELNNDAVYPVSLTRNASYVEGTIDGCKDKTPTLNDTRPSTSQHIKEPSGTAETAPNPVLNKNGTVETMTMTNQKSTCGKKKSSNPKAKTRSSKETPKPYFNRTEANRLPSLTNVGDIMMPPLTNVSDIALHSFGSLYTGQGYTFVHGTPQECEILNRNQQKSQTNTVHPKTKTSILHRPIPQICCSQQQQMQTPPMTDYERVRRIIDSQRNLSSNSHGRSSLSDGEISDKNAHRRRYSQEMITDTVTSTGLITSTVHSYPPFADSNGHAKKDFGLSENALKLKRIGSRSFDSGLDQNAGLRRHLFLQQQRSSFDEAHMYGVNSSRHMPVSSSVRNPYPFNLGGQWLRPGETPTITNPISSQPFQPGSQLPSLYTFPRPALEPCQVFPQVTRVIPQQSRSVLQPQGSMNVAQLPSLIDMNRGQSLDPWSNQRNFSSMNQPSSIHHNLKRTERFFNPDVPTSHSLNQDYQAHTSSNPNLSFMRHSHLVAKANERPKQFVEGLRTDSFSRSGKSSSKYKKKKKTASRDSELGSSSKSSVASQEKSQPKTSATSVQLNASQAPASLTSAVRPPGEPISDSIIITDDVSQSDTQREVGQDVSRDNVASFDSHISGDNRSRDSGAAYSLNHQQARNSAILQPLVRQNIEQFMPSTSAPNVSDSPQGEQDEMAQGNHYVPRINTTNVYGSQLQEPVPLQGNVQSFLTVPASTTVAALSSLDQSTLLSGAFYSEAGLPSTMISSSSDLRRLANQEVIVSYSPSSSDLRYLAGGDENVLDVIMEELKEQIRQLREEIRMDSD